MKSSSLLFILTILLGALGLIGFVGHIAFRIMHWPGSATFRIMGLGCAVLAFALFFAYRSLLKKESANPAPRQSPHAEISPKTAKTSFQKEAKTRPETPIDGSIDEDIWEDDEE